MSILSRAFAARSLLALAMAAGVAATTPGPARADGAGIVLADGGRHDHDGHRGDRRGGRDWGDDRGRHWRGDGRHHDRRHWRPGPPPHAYHHYYAPPRPRPYYRSCHIEWNFWYGGYVRVCV